MNCQLQGIKPLLGTFYYEAAQDVEDLDDTDARNVISTLISAGLDSARNLESVPLILSLLQSAHMPKLSSNALAPPSTPFKPTTTPLLNPKSPENTSHERPKSVRDIINQFNN